MAGVSVRRRVRPIRFAFLVDHRDPAALRKAVEVNTVLWAGMFNAIVPVFKRTPPTWRTKRTANEIVRGYLDAFEPDFVITASGIDAAAYGIPRTNTDRLDTMLTRDGLEKRGTDVMDVYRWRYQRDFRFIRRDPIALRLPVAATTAFRLFGATVFGAFPGLPLGHFEKGFRDLGGEDVPLAPASYGDTLSGAIYPLSLGTSGLDDPGSRGPRRAFFLLNPRNVGDLIDFWNLRALGWRIVAVPIEWIADLAPSIAKTIQAEHQPSTHFNPNFHRARVLCGRSVPPSVVTTFLTAVGVGGDVTQVQGWLPRLWEESVRDADDAIRVELSAGKDEVKADRHEDRITFKTVGPVFARRRWGHEVRVANVIELRSSDLPNLANIIPKDFLDLDGLLRSFGRGDMIRNSSEGITLLADSREQSVTWRLPQGVRVLAEWLKPHGELQLSSAGKIAARLIGLVGGPDWVRLVANVDLVRLLGRATESASRDIPHRDLLALLQRFLRNHGEAVERRIEGLVRQKVLKLGIRLKCDQCTQQNWFALDELREDLTCQWCLDELPFPSAMPPNPTCWSYRPLGPFAARGHAQGAYVVAAALKTFSRLGSFPRTTWSPSFTLTMADGVLEADFGLLWQSDEARLHAPQFILGECKTFGDFESKDAKRTRLLAKKFPNAVIAFATFKERLSVREKTLLEAFARWGRKGWRTPVMILTARELTSDDEMPHCWRGTGVDLVDKVYDAVNSAPSPLTSLRRLADATQQIHLDMPADPGWPHYDKP